MTNGIITVLLVSASSKSHLGSSSAMEATWKTSMWASISLMWATLTSKPSLERSSTEPFFLPTTTTTLLVLSHLLYAPSRHTFHTCRSFNPSPPAQEKTKRQTQKANVDVVVDVYHPEL